MVRSAAGLVLGTAQWGSAYGIANKVGQPSTDAISSIVDIARGQGVHTIDTARVYGESESIIGRLVGSDPYWSIVTKVDPSVGEHENSYNDCRASLRRSIEQSLKALQRSSLDVVLLHNGEQRWSAGGAVWEATLEAKEEGLVAQVGISARTPEQAVRALNDPTIECLQVATSILDQRLASRGWFARAAALGKTVFVRSVFLQGSALLDPSALPEGLVELASPIASMRTWAGHRLEMLLSMCLAFARSLGPVQVLVGCELPSQLDEIIRAWHSEVDGVALLDFAATIPALPDEVLDPSMWSTK